MIGKIFAMLNRQADDERGIEVDKMFIRPYKLNIFNANFSECMRLMHHS